LVSVAFRKMGQGALPKAVVDDYELSTLVLVAGVLYAGYKKGAEKYEAQICHVLDPEPYAVITTVKEQVDVFSTKIRRPFKWSELINNDFYVVTKLRQVDGLAEGKKKGEDFWLPIKKTDDLVLYVKDPNTGQVKLVILEHARPFTSLEKAGIGFGMGLSVVGAAVAAIVAAPFAVAGLGFGAGGIALGSTASTMMSLGVVGVATLQSIGAAGMGVASMIVMGTVGSTVGAAAVGATAAGVAASTGTSKFVTSTETATVMGVRESESALITTHAADGKKMKALLLMRDQQPVQMPPVDAFLGL